MRAADDFNPSRTAKRLLREARKGALATLLPGGAPYASLVTIACAMDAAPILLLSRLARHTANLATDSRVSLLLEEAGAPRSPPRPRGRPPGPSSPGHRPAPPPRPPPPPPARPPPPR